MGIAKALSGEIVSVGMRGSVRVRAIGTHVSVCQFTGMRSARRHPAAAWRCSRDPISERSLAARWPIDLDEL